MPVITEMQLPYLPVDDPGFYSDPMPFVEQARKQHPWLARFDAGYLVHGYGALKDLAFMDDKMGVGLDSVVAFYGAQGTPWAAFMEQMLLSHTGPEHTRLRTSVVHAFTPKMANQARPLMQQQISLLLDDWLPLGEFDFADFASYFPISVLMGVMGVPTSHIPAIRNAIETHMAALSLDKSRYDDIMAAYDVLWQFADQLVRDRQKAGTAGDSGLLDTLITAAGSGQLSDTELRYLILVLLIGGYDTSKNLLTLTVHQLLQHPDYWQRCAGDRKFCGKVIEEMLRHSNIATVFRTVRETFDYDGHTFPKDTFLAFATPLANRDPAAFPEPLVFDPERSQTNRHLAFGRGVHVCLGQFLARAQLEEGLHLIASRMPHPQLVGDIRWRPMLGAWGLWTLPIRFAPPGRG